MSDEASKFDPRFDPAFQRGFDGKTQATPREKLQPTSVFAPVAAPPARPVAAAQPEAVQAVNRVVVEPTEIVDDEGEARRVNPFLIALLAAAVLLIGGGIYLVSRLGEMFANPSASSQYDYITLQALTIAAPMLIVLGVATAIGVLFIYAVRWGRR